MSGAAIFLLTLAASFLPDAVALPRSAPPWWCSAAALVTHGPSVVTVSLLMLAVSVRPVFTGFVAVSLTGLLAVVSNAKYASLRGSLVFLDLNLPNQLSQHPRMYLPFLSSVSVLVFSFGAAVFVGMMVLNMPLQGISWGLLLADTTASFFLRAWAVRTLRLTMQLDADQHQHGFYTVSVVYLLNGLRPTTAAALCTVMSHGPFSRTAESTARPDVTVIQSESFFDARQLSLAVCADLLPDSDATCAEVVQCGQLEVPAWGANTMCMELAVLSGLDPGAQDYARSYLHAYIRQPRTSLVGWFRRADYRTSAMHPYHRDFSDQHHVLSLVHFDRFLGIRHFNKARRVGPYMADLAVADAIRVEPEATGDSPAFVFAMTIENHGSLHLEHVTPGEVASYHAFGEGKLWNGLTAYLRHLVSADAMIGQLTRYLAARKRPAILYFYGDHVPASPVVYRQTDYLPTHSDYLLWRSDAALAPPGQQKHMRVHAESLGKLPIDCISAPLPASQGAGASRTNAVSTESQQQ